MDSLFRPAQQKVSAGADPKSVLCLFYRQGQCKKGDKCKFSHDMSLEGKSEKRSMYVDARELEEGKQLHAHSHIDMYMYMNCMYNIHVRIHVVVCCLNL